MRTLALFVLVAAACVAISSACATPPDNSPESPRHSNANCDLAPRGHKVKRSGRGGKGPAKPSTMPAINKSKNPEASQHKNPSIKPMKPTKEISRGRPGGKGKRSTSPVIPDQKPEVIQQKPAPTGANGGPLGPMTGHNKVKRSGRGGKGPAKPSTMPAINKSKNPEASQHKNPSIKPLKPTKEISKGRPGGKGKRSTSPVIPDQKPVASQDKPASTKAPEPSKPTVETGPKKTILHAAKETEKLKKVLDKLPAQTPQSVSSASSDSGKQKPDNAISTPVVSQKKPASTGAPEPSESTTQTGPKTTIFNVAKEHEKVKILLQKHQQAAAKKPVLSPASPDSGKQKPDNAISTPVVSQKKPASTGAPEPTQTGPKTTTLNAAKGRENVKIVLQKLQQLVAANKLVLPAAETPQSVSPASPDSGKQNPDNAISKPQETQKPAPGTTLEAKDSKGMKLNRHKRHPHVKHLNAEQKEEEMQRIINKLNGR